MEQLELLWEYQQADVAVDKAENAIKRSPARQKLVKMREYLVEQQNNIKHIEDEVEHMADRLEALKEAISRAEDQFKALQAKLQAEPASDSASARGYIQEAQKLLGSISEYETEVRRIAKDASARERLQKDVRTRAAQTKAEFDKLKAVYDEEYKAKSSELAALKAELAEKAKGISPDYMARYQNIKKHSVPPLAKLRGEQCGGCNMSLPSSVVRSLKNGQEVECETCGRLLLL